MSPRTLARAARNPVAAIGTAIVLVGGTGVAGAATGGTFVLGQSNTATTRTSLANPNGTPLSLTAKAGAPPLGVSNSVKVPRLNSDLLDGVDSTQLQRRVSGTCAGGAVTAVGSAGGVTCAPLPVKIHKVAGVGDTAVATFGGTTLRVSCTVAEDAEGKRLNAFVYLTGSGIVNGHTTTMLHSKVHTIEQVGAAIPAGGTGAKLQTADAPELAVSRQSALLMVQAGEQVTQLTLHLLADARQLPPVVSPQPCTVWGTAI